VSALVIRGASAKPVAHFTEHRAEIRLTAPSFSRENTRNTSSDQEPLAIFDTTMMAGPTFSSSRTKLKGCPPGKAPTTTSITTNHTHLHRLSPKGRPLNGWPGVFVGLYNDGSNTVPSSYTAKNLAYHKQRRRTSPTQPKKLIRRQRKSLATGAPLSLRPTQADLIIAN